MDSTVSRELNLSIQLEKVSKLFHSVAFCNQSLQHVKANSLKVDSFSLLKAEKEDRLYRLYTSQKIIHESGT